MEELDLKTFFKYIFSKQLVVALFIVLSLMIGLSYSFNLKIPKYKSTTTVVLTTENNKPNSSITQYDLTLNQNLVTTYSEIIKSKRVLRQVIKSLNLNMSVGELGSMVQVGSVSDTEIISITVTNEDSKLACDIANKIAEIFTKEVVELYNIENINVVDHAEEAKAPYNINYIKDTVIYILIGVAVGYTILICSFYFDTTLKQVDDIEEKLHLPLIGTIPLLSSKKKNKINDELVVHENSKSLISEGIKTLRTNLQFSSVDKKLKTILVASSIPGEGKSFISTNLAIAFAQTGKKVLIVDCDMRKGRQHQIFKIKNELGLSDLLISDNIESCKNFFHKTKVNNLYLLTMGTIPPNPTELLGSEKNKRLVELFSRHFDIVIYDGVPVNGLSDSLVMSKLVDKVVIVSELKHTPYELLNNTKKSLQKVNANIAGVIINKIPYSGKAYTYEGYYGYYK